MKFGKHIQAHQVPGWSPYYLDYKFLKKIISSLAANRPASEAAALASGIRPTDILTPSVTSSSTPGPQRSPTATPDHGSDGPPIFPGSNQDDERGPDFRAHKAAFFFKLERELEKINAFYLQREAELKLRMETLLSKRRAAAMRGLPDPSGNLTQNHAEWSAVEEGFRVLERDLGKLQQFIEINAVGFRKILKKFDKRSISTTKELYLSRQVDVQPVFNRQLISELADTVAICLLDLTDLSSGLKFESSTTNDILTQQMLTEPVLPSGPFRDLENNLRKAVSASDTDAIADCVRYSDVLSQQNGGKPNVTRILWNIIVEAPFELADLILAFLSSPFDFQFIDDINGRTCLHEAAIAGAPRLVDLCIDKGVQLDKADVYGRTALHYACMKGYAAICKRLLAEHVSPDTVDRDNYSPLVYATLKGSVECVGALLDEGKVPAEPAIPFGDLIPLSLASQSGHVDVVLLLLQHGAHCLPNTNGEYPMHLAARGGHAEVCKHLLHLEGWDTPDKYHEWTPLFHASRYGRVKCVKILLEAGANVQAQDELRHFSTHYAAWYGHHDCLEPLLQASKKPSSGMQMTVTDDSPASDPGNHEPDIDLIPSLSLPPPIMPHRVYGHNYLDRSHLVQISVGFSSRQQSKASGVRLHHRRISSVFQDEYLVTSTPLKLVMTTSPSVTSAPYSISLPQREEKGAFTFHIPSLDTLSLEFSVYPNFGTKTIGRAVALPTLFVGIESNQRFTLPILDTRLNVVGEVDFEINIITAFEGVTLEVGGDIETYWKSMAIPIIAVPQPGLSHWPHRSSLIGSAQASPSVHSVSNTGGQALTVSSLQGVYVHAVIQVTRDLHPVLYPDWMLPDVDFDLAVSDVTLVQFEAMAQRLGKNLESVEATIAVDEWPALLSNCMISLTRLLKILPLGVNVCLELARPSRDTLKRLALGRRLDLNDFVDSVLRTIYQASNSFDSMLQRRRIVFTSFHPDVCSAINWKQPNYPVFFASRCGKKDTGLFSPSALGAEDDDDPRFASVGAAVEFARTNNLLGIFVDATLLVHVPSLINGIRNAGLLVGTHGTPDDLNCLSTTSDIEGTPVDAVLGDGKVVFLDHSMQEI